MARRRRRGRDDGELHPEGRAGLLTSGLTGDQKPGDPHGYTQAVNPKERA